MKPYYLILSLFILSLGYSQSPQIIKSGIYVESIHNLSPKHQEFDTSFWVWFLHDSPDYQPSTRLNIVNAKEFKQIQSITEKKGNSYWTRIQYKAKIKHEWEMYHYPFDQQNFQIQIEDDECIQSITFQPDTQQSSISSEAIHPEWTMKNFKLSHEAHTYLTTYGDPELKDHSTHSRLNTTISLERNGFRLFVDIMMGVYIAFILAMLAFYIPLSTFVGKFSYVASSIFAAIGSKYIVDSRLPEITHFTLIDRIQWITFAIIAISAFMSLLTVLAHKTHSEQKVLTFNKRVSYLCLVFYIMLNWMWLSSI